MSVVAEYLNVVTEERSGCQDDCLRIDSTGQIYDKNEIFTKREQKVLARIRENRREAGLLLDQVHSLNGDEDTRGLKEKALERLEGLRRERAGLEAERRDAAEDRMRLLGHA